MVDWCRKLSPGTNGAVVISDLLGDCPYGVSVCPRGDRSCAVDKKRCYVVSGGSCGVSLIVDYNHYRCERFVADIQF